MVRHDQYCQHLLYFMADIFPFSCFLWHCDPTRVIVSSFLRFLDHTQRRTTVGRTPLDEWSDCRTDLHLITHNTHNRQKPITPTGFEAAGERPQTHTLRGPHTSLASESGWARVPASQTRPCVECHEPDFGRLYTECLQKNGAVSKIY
jgi:hypothetical protein